MQTTQRANQSKSSCRLWTHAQRRGALHQWARSVSARKRSSSPPMRAQRPNLPMQISPSSAAKQQQPSSNPHQLRIIPRLIFFRKKNTEADPCRSAHTHHELFFPSQTLGESSQLSQDPPIHKHSQRSSLNHQTTANILGRYAQKHARTGN